uniref:myb-like protein V n=1 Tax=Erigeron canadensis TaxID=72917 RepID=UPI001CB89734|nr:myb-like protein V [Erigeron canadensis]
MEDSFKVRVDKTFGSLEPSSSSSTNPTQQQNQSSSLNSLWSLTDEEIETNKWIHHKKPTSSDIKDIDEQIHRLKNPKPVSPFLQGLLAQPSSASDHNLLKSDIQELDDDVDDDDDNEDDENEKKHEVSKPDDHNEEEWNIRSSVGMDPTLDNEEEEDAYDKVAVGKDLDPEDRFYMKDVNDYDVEMDSNGVLPRSFTEVTRDPRANHKAAKLRLKEDDESAKKLCLQASEKKIPEPITKENQIATESKQHLVMNKPSGSKVVPSFPQSSSSVPDHLRNPSKYTHYTFDSLDDVDEESNRKAFMNFSNMVKRSAAMEMDDDVPADITKSIIFTPKKKSDDVSMKDSKVDGHENKKAVPISIDDSEVCMMDEDEPEVATNLSSGVQKGGRRYRTKGSVNDE